MKVYTLRYYNMTKENVRVSGRTTNSCRSSGTTNVGSYRLIMAYKNPGQNGLKKKKHSVLMKKKQ